MTNKRTHRLRWSTLVAVVAVLPLALAGCVGEDKSPGPTTTTPPTRVAPIAPTDKNAPVTLTWWTGQFADAQKTLEGIAAEFSAKHPNVTIKLSSGGSTTDDLLQKLSAGFAADVYPDVSYAFGSWASQLADSGRTLDITGNIADPAVKWDDFPEAARETAAPGGRTIGFPAIVDNLALFYNTTLFDAAGLAYPTKDWTWDDFRAAAKKLTNPAKNVYGTGFDVSAGEGTTWSMWPQLWQNGGSILSADEKTSAFNSAAGVAAVSYWRDLAQTDKSVYLDQTAEKAAPLFISNNIGLLITGPWELYDLSVAKTKYGVTVLPGTKGNHQTVSGPDLWVLFDHKDANRAYWSYELVRWLTEGPQDEKWNMVLGNLPLRASERTSATFAATVKQYPGYDVLAANLDNATQKRPTVKGYVELSKAFGKAVSRLLQGDGDVKAELDKAAAVADAALADQ